MSHVIHCWRSVKVKCHSATFDFFFEIGLVLLFVQDLLSFPVVQSRRGLLQRNTGPPGVYLLSLFFITNLQIKYHFILNKQTSVLWIPRGHRITLSFSSSFKLSFGACFTAWLLKPAKTLCSIFLFRVSAIGGSNIKAWKTLFSFCGRRSKNLVFCVVSLWVSYQAIAPLTHGQLTALSTSSYILLEGLFRM